MAMQDSFRRIAEKNTKSRRFAVWKMWFGIFISRLFPDRAAIPENIGNSVVINNNMYITKTAITKLVLITDLGLTSPIAFMSEATLAVKQRVHDVNLDYVIKGASYSPNLTSGGLTSRLTQWRRVLDNEESSTDSAERAARLLYSADVARSGIYEIKGRFYIRVKATTGVKVAAALKALENYLDDCNVEYRVIADDVDTHLKYTAMLSNKTISKINDVPYNIFSSETIAELLPDVQGLNDSSGVLLGINERNKQPYLIDFKQSSNAKNILLVGLSGFGKTFLVISWLFDFSSQGYNICLCDIKGEFRSFVKGRSGTILSMGSSSHSYVNTYVFPNKNPEDPIAYFNSRFSESRERLRIILNLSPDKESRGLELIDRILLGFYNNLGVLRENPNTWARADTCVPDTLYEYFMSHVAVALRPEYPDIIPAAISAFKMYLSKDGAAASMFENPISVEDVIETDVLSFDFGLLEDTQVPDEIIFKLRVRDMELIDSEFGRAKKAKHEWVVFVGEESQVVKDFVMETYKNKITLNRAMNYITVILGNSVTALADNPIARPILDNINIFAIGLVYKSSREYLVKEFGLEGYMQELEDMAEENYLDNTFLLVNKMQKNGAPALLRAQVPPDVAEGKMFKNVDTE